MRVARRRLVIGLRLSENARAILTSLPSTWSISQRVRPLTRLHATNARRRPRRRLRSPLVRGSPLVRVRAPIAPTRSKPTPAAAGRSEAEPNAWRPTRSPYRETLSDVSHVRACGLSWDASEEPHFVFLASLTPEVLEGREPVYNRKPEFRADFIAAVSINHPRNYRVFIMPVARRSPEPLGSKSEVMRSF